jgi:predicted CoA-binding protein
MSVPTEHEQVSSRMEFWTRSSFAVVGHSGSAKSFPMFTYRGLKASGKTVFPIDPGAGTIDGDRTYRDFGALPRTVDAVVLEVPKLETAGWVQGAADAGIRHVWIHMGTETPEALEIARQRDLRIETGTCAAMYVTPGLTFHSLHKWAMQLFGNY